LKEFNYKKKLDAERLKQEFRSLGNIVNYTQEPYSPEVNVACEDLIIKSTEGRKGSLICAVIIL
jgi:hypothetical protein